MGCILAAVMLFCGIFTGGERAMEMEKVHGSFQRNFQGEIVTPAPYVALIKSKSDFTQFFMDRTLFFDGRFMIYEKIDGTDFFDTNDLIVLIVRGEHELKSLEANETAWELSLSHTEGNAHTMYFLYVPKSENEEVILK